MTQSNPNDDSYRIVSDALKAYQNFPDYFEAWGNTDLYYMAAPWQVGMFLLLLFLNFFSFGHGNVLYTTLNIVSVYLMFYYLIKIIERLSHHEINWFILVVLLGLWIVPIAYIPYIYGWQLGLGLAVFGIYEGIVAFDNNSWKFFGISIFTLFIACLIKTNYMIVFVALILVYGMKWINMQYDFKWLCKVGLTILFLGLSMMTPKWIVGRITHQSVSGTPQINILTMGAQEGMFGAGWFNGYAYSVFYDHYGDPQGNREQVSADLKSRLNKFMDSPHVAFDFYKRKLDSMILTKDFQIHAYYNMNDGIGNRYLNQSPVREITYTVNSLDYGLIAIGLLAGAFALIKNKTVDEKHTLFGLLLCGALMYHLLFEGKAIYLYPWITMASPLVYLGLINLGMYCNSKRISKHSVAIIVAGICFIFGAAVIYNKRPLEVVQYEQYSNDQQIFWLDQGNYVEQPFYLDEDSILDSLQVMVKSFGVTNETIGLEIRDSTDEILFTQYYSANMIEMVEPFIVFDLNNLKVNAGEYSVYIYSDSIQHNIGLTTGNQFDTSYQAFALNGYDQSEMLNLKIIGKIKTRMTYSSIYDSLGNS